MYDDIKEQIRNFFVFVAFLIAVSLGIGAVVGYILAGCVAK